MTFGQFIGQVKAGKGMAAIARESNRLGVRKIENGLRIGVSIAKAVPQLRSAATAVGKGLDTLAHQRQEAATPTLECCW